MRKIIFTTFCFLITAISYAQKSSLIITNIETADEKHYPFGNHVKLTNANGITYKGVLKQLDHSQSVVLIKKDTIALNSISILKIRTDAVSLTGTVLAITGAIAILVGAASYLPANKDNPSYISSASVLACGVVLTGAGLSVLSIHKKYDHKKYQYKIKN